MPPVTFLQLPREICDRIYGFVLVKKEISLACRDESGCRDERREYAISGIKAPIPIPPLLLVNRQISAEAAVSYYGKLIMVGQPPDLVLFLGKFFLGQDESCRTLIKAVKVNYISEFNNEAWLPQLFNSLSSLSGLRSVALVISSENLTVAQTKLAGMGLDLLKGQVELIIDNLSFYRKYLNDTYKLSVRKSIGRRAAGAMDWVNEEEKVTDIM